jgi:uncharacterized protein YndB with AHSA1/START domain
LARDDNPSILRLRYDDMASYRLVTEWHADASRDRVWNALLDVRAWPSWWRGFRAVDVLHPGEDSGVGMVLRQQWRSLISYTLTFDLEVMQLVQGQRLDGRMTGDVEGVATWTMDEHDGGTRIRFVMDVRPSRPWMGLPLPFAGRIFAANYDAVMRWGCEGLGRVLAARVADGTVAVGLAGA